jgi:drug/metabolite transporter (DMT)-like permease
MKKLVWAVPLLVMALVAISSAATAFQFLKGVSGSLKAAWRLQVCAYVMLTLQTFDWVKRFNDCCRMWHQGWKHMLCGGVLVGLHYTLFAMSLQLTSMAHCLVFLCCDPIVLVLYQLVTSQPLYKWEVLGMTLSMSGIFLVILDIDWTSCQENCQDEVTQATWYGDLLALLSMLTYALYMIISQTMLKERRSPLFAFFAPVNVVASLTAFFFASLQGEGDLYFSWAEPSWIWPVLYLGVVPGIIGQLSLTFLFGQVSLILVAICINLEPLIGSLMGWTFGFQGEPSIFLWVGGLVSITGNAVVVIYGNDAKEANKTPDVSLHEQASELVKPLQ